MAAVTTAQLAFRADVSMRSPPPTIHGLGCGNHRIGHAGDVIRDSNVLYAGRQMVDVTSHVVAYLETGYVTTQATGVAIRTINHLSHRER